MGLDNTMDEKTATTRPESVATKDGSHNDANELEPVQTNNARPACFSSTVQEVLFVLTATMAIAMGALLTGSVTVISSFIGRDLGMTTAQITWIASATSLSSGALLLFFGKVADLFGRYCTIDLTRPVLTDVQAASPCSSGPCSCSLYSRLSLVSRRHPSRWMFYAESLVSSLPVPCLPPLASWV